MEEQKLCYRKIKDQKGESIAETLVALLVAALGITMLAAGISSSTKLIKESKHSMENYYAANNELSLMSGSGDPGTVNLEFEGSTITKLHGKTGIGVYYYSNGNVVSYRIR